MRHSCYGRLELSGCPSTAPHAKWGLLGCCAKSSRRSAATLSHPAVLMEGMDMLIHLLCVEAMLKGCAHVCR